MKGYRPMVSQFQQSHPLVYCKSRSGTGGYFNGAGGFIAPDTEQSLNTEDAHRAAYMVIYPTVPSSPHAVYKWSLMSFPTQHVRLCAMTATLVFATNLVPTSIRRESQAVVISDRHLHRSSRPRRILSPCR
jgi:hypothetical protein